ncbi:hypothetical protein, partial [Staphylococcus aureus]
KSASKGIALEFTNNQCSGDDQEECKIANYVWESTNKCGVKELVEIGVGNGTVTVFDHNTNRTVGEAVTKGDES